MKRIASTLAATIALAVALAVPANAGRGHGRFIGGLVAGALIGGLVSREAHAYRHRYDYADGHYDWRYRTNPRSDYGYPAPNYYRDQAPRYDWNERNGFYGYRDNGAVPVTPSHCSRPIYDQASRSWRCPPVLVPRY
jgi:hypothetical protein